MIESKETLVTAFVDLSRIEGNTQRRTGEQYVEYSKSLLALDVNLYLFLEEDLVPLVRERREMLGFKDKTFIETISFSTLYCYPFLEQIKENRKKNPVINASGFKDTPNYITMINSKIDLVCKAIERNPFSSTHFAWIDFGIFHIARKDYIFKDKVFENFPDRIKLEWMLPVQGYVLNPVFQYTRIRASFAAGYITGASVNWKGFWNIFYNEFSNALKLGYGPSEEQIFSVIYHRQPKFFDIYLGEYNTVLSNYRKTRLFHTRINRKFKDSIKKNSQEAQRIVEIILPQIEGGEIEIDPKNLLAFLIQSYQLYSLIYGKHHENTKAVQNLYIRRMKEDNSRFLRINRPPCL